jgi:hypothetical protein
MAIESRENEVEGEVDEGRQVIVHYETATLKWKGFESQIVILTKIYGRV